MDPKKVVESEKLERPHITPGSAEGDSQTIEQDLDGRESKTAQRGETEENELGGQDFS